MCVCVETTIVSISHSNCQSNLTATSSGKQQEKKKKKKHFSLLLLYDPCFRKCRNIFAFAILVPRSQCRCKCVASTWLCYVWA